MNICLTSCPICGSKALGRVAQKQYFCSNCYNEINVSKETVNIYAVLEDGSLELRSLDEAKHLIQSATN